MKFLLLPLILLFVLPVQNAQNDSSLVVLSFKWSKSRQAVEKVVEPPNPAPAAAMIPQNKNYPRNARINDPVGARDPNLDTTDGRAAALEKAVQDSRTPQGKTVDGFAYRVKVQNGGTKDVDIVFWEYQFIDASDPNLMTRRQFLCGVSIKAEKAKEIQAFDVSGPGEVVSADSLAKSKNPLQEKVVINRVEYADGSIWQRKDWKFAEIRTSYQRAIATPWGKEMCRSL
jgi:hypothetical protein